MIFDKQKEEKEGERLDVPVFLPLFREGGKFSCDRKKSGIFLLLLKTAIKTQGKIVKCHGSILNS